jgi:hypothetical protein
MSTHSENVLSAASPEAARLYHKLRRALQPIGHFREEVKRPRYISFARRPSSAYIFDEAICSSP